MEMLVSILYFVSVYKVNYIKHGKKNVKFKEQIIKYTICGTSKSKS